MQSCVSVSLRSIIHSYLYYLRLELITLYYDFSFRLITEIHSFLLLLSKSINVFTLLKFPSPYGVSFILINIKVVEEMAKNQYSFRLLTEYHSFLL